MKFIESIEEGVDLMGMFYPFLETIFHQLTTVQCENIMDAFLAHIKLAKHEQRVNSQVWGEEE